MRKRHTPERLVAPQPMLRNAVAIWGPFGSTIATVRRRGQCQVFSARWFVRSKLRSPACAERGAAGGANRRGGVAARHHRAERLRKSVTQRCSKMRGSVPRIAGHASRAVIQLLEEMMSHQLYLFINTHPPRNACPPGVAAATVRRAFDAASVSFLP